MRHYDIAIASLAVDAPLKWMDNLLSQHDVPDVVVERRGVARRIPYGALVRIALVRELHTALGMSVRDAVGLAGELLGPGSGDRPFGAVRIVLDRAILEQSVDRRLRHALESAPAPRRGRPPRRDASGGRGGRSARSAAAAK